MDAVSQKCGFGEALFGSHCVRLIHTHLLKGYVALQYVYFASFAFHYLITPSGSRISEMRLRRGFDRISLCSPDPYESFERMCGPPIYIFCELCLPLTGTPSGSRISEMRFRRGFARISLCSPDPYASFERMCGPPICIFCELCLPLTGTPSGSSISEMRLRRGFAQFSLCSPDPYASFERMCHLQYVYFASYAFH